MDFESKLQIIVKWKVGYQPKWKKQVESDKDSSSYENLLNKIKRSFLCLSLILFQCLNSHVPLLKIGDQLKRKEEFLSY